MQITVDGDTSTNDTVLGLASGKAGGEVISDPKSTEAKDLDAAVTALLQVSLMFACSTLVMHVQVHFVAQNVLCFLHLQMEGLEGLFQRGLVCALMAFKMRQTCIISSSFAAGRATGC